MIGSESAEDRALVMELIAKHLEIPVETVVPSASLVSDLHADLLTMANLALALEAKFDIEIPDDEWLDVTTVSEAVDYVLARIVSHPRRKRDGARV